MAMVWSRDWDFGDILADLSRSLPSPFSVTKCLVRGIDEAWRLIFDRTLLGAGFSWIKARSQVGIHFCF